MLKILNNIQTYKNQIALVTDSDCLSYRDLIKQSDKIKKQIKLNSVVLLVADNSSDFVVGYISFISKEKTINILADNSFSIEFLEKIIKNYEPNYIYVSKNNKYFEKKYQKILNYNSYTLFETDFSNHKKLNFKNFLLLSTSGTTQSPKFVRLSRKNLEDNTIKIANHLSIKKNHTTITTMPMGYSYGLSILNTHLLLGAKIVLNKCTILEKSFWSKVIKHKVNSFGGVPEFYEFLRRINFERHFHTSIKYLTQAGGKLNEETLKYFGDICKKKKIKFYVMYGQTEASPRMSLLNWNMFFKKINSIGKPLKGYKMNLISKNKKLIKKNNQEGEIVFHGNNVSLGYAKNLKDLRSGDINKKSLFTGDIAYKDKDNFYYIIGRKKRFIKLFGKRFDLKEIENFLFSHGIKVRCNLSDSKLTLNLYNNFQKAQFIKNLLHKHLNINQNYILIKTSYKKTFKDF